MESAPRAAARRLAGCSSRDLQATAECRLRVDVQVRRESSTGSRRPARIPSGSARGCRRRLPVPLLLQRMDRLASQLLEVSAPPPVAAVHERLGTRPADPDELRSLAEQMGLPDGEG